MPVEVQDRILVLDDEPGIVQVATRALQRSGYHVSGATNARLAIDVASRERVDLLLTDIHIPDMVGLDVATILRRRRPDLMVVVMTGQGTMDLAVRALHMGTQGFIVKPFTAGDLVARVRDAIERYRLLQENLRLRVLAPALEETVAALAAAIDARDRATGSHTNRLLHLASGLSRLAGMDDDERELVRRGAMLHDVGKIGVPDSILRKPGPLTSEEQRLMRTHPVVGAGMVAKITGLANAATLVLHHHERWDGSGYPDRLAGEAIPIGARILAVADAYDAMTSARPYRPAMSCEAARAELQRAAGNHLDPRLVPLFLHFLDIDDAMPASAPSPSRTTANVA